MKKNERKIQNENQKEKKVTNKRNKTKRQTQTNNARKTGRYTKRNNKKRKQHINDSKTKTPDGRTGLKKTVLQKILGLPKKLFFTV